MFKINLDDRTLEQLDERSFSELNLRERDDLQEWIAKQPEALGEELLVIQKEFAGFGNTKERLDLLALDKQGDLVIIENKLDDSGRDVVWQAIKYASYCSSLTKEDVKDIYQRYLDGNKTDEKAEENLSEFLEEDFEEVDLNPGVTQRIILVAAKFRQEVTSTVLWLLNHNIKMQCFVAKPYTRGKDVFLTINQIIPTKDPGDYMITMAEKAQVAKVADTVRERNRSEYWEILLEAMEKESNEHAKMFNIRKGNFVSTDAGMAGVRYRLAADPKIARVVLIIRKNNPHREYIYSELEKHKEEIHAALGFELEWKVYARASVARFTVPGDVSDKSRWDEMIKFHIDHFIPMEKAFRNPLQKIFRQLQQSQKGR